MEFEHFVPELKTFIEGMWQHEERMSIERVDSFRQKKYIYIYIYIYMYIECALSFVYVFSILISFGYVFSILISFGYVFSILNVLSHLGVCSVY